jgi:transposase
VQKHTEEFKREAVRIALTSELSRRRVASDLGVGLSTLGKWVCEYRPADPVAAPQADLARENERRKTVTSPARPMGRHWKRLLEPYRALAIKRLKALMAETAERGQ